MRHHIIHAVQPVNVFNCAAETNKLDRLMCSGGRAAKRIITLSWYIIKNHFTIIINFLVLVAHNGFSFDFSSLVAEVKRQKLDGVLAPVKPYYADTLHDIKRINTIVHSYLDVL